MALPVPLRRLGTTAPPPAAPPSAARARLIECTAALTETAARLAALEEAGRRAAAAVTAAREAHAAAETAIPTAIAAAAKHATAALLGEAGSAPPSVARARAALQAAADDLATAEAVREAIETEATDLAARLPLRHRNREDAAKALLAEDAAPAIAALRAEVEELRRQLNDKAATLSWLDSLVWPPVARPVEGFSKSAVDPQPTMRRWEAALAALLDDPHAPVPRLS